MRLPFAEGKMALESRIHRSDGRMGDVGKFRVTVPGPASYVGEIACSTQVGQTAEPEKESAP